MLKATWALARYRWGVNDWNKNVKCSQVANMHYISFSIWQKLCCFKIHMRWTVSFRQNRWYMSNTLTLAKRKFAKIAYFKLRNFSICHSKVGGVVVVITFWSEFSCSQYKFYRCIVVNLDFNLVKLILQIVYVKTLQYI